MSHEILTPMQVHDHLTQKTEEMNMDTYTRLLNDHPWYKLSRWRQWLTVFRFCTPWGVMHLMEENHRLIRNHWKCSRDHGGE